MDLELWLPWLTAFATHPATWSVGAFAAAGLAVAVVTAQLRGIGLVDDAGRGIVWSRVLSVVIFWTVALGGLSAVAFAEGSEGLGTLLTMAFGTVLTLLPATVLLMSGNVYGRHRRAAAERAGDKEGAEQEVRLVHLVLGLLAALVVAQASFPAMLLVGLVGVLVWLATDASGRERVQRLWAEWQAGHRLRQRHKPDAKLVLHGHEVALLGQIGFFDTVVLRDREALTIPNTELLTATMALPGP